MTYEQDEAEFLEAMAAYFCLAGEAKEIFVQRFLDANTDLTDAGIADILNLKQGKVTYYLNELCDKRAAKGFEFQKQRGRWTEVKAWLRSTAYPNWQKRHRPPEPELRELDWLWHNLKQRAEPFTDWMNFVALGGGDKALVVPPPNPNAVPRLVLKAPYAVRLEVPCPEWHLLLLNQGLESRYLMLPSMAFAPAGKLTHKPLLMPQKGAMVKELSFDAPGREEFIGVAVRAMPKLDWLQPSDNEPAPELNRLRLNQLWRWLQQQQWRVFYREFEVVN